MGKCGLYNFMLRKTRKGLLSIQNNPFITVISNRHPCSYVQTNNDKLKQECDRVMAEKEDRPSAILVQSNTMVLDALRARK
jgi:hypothetical protein